MAAKKTVKKKQGRQIQLSDSQKKILLVSSGSVVAVALAWWAYFAFTTITPPDLTKAPAKEVARYLGNERGFTRLSYDDRKNFIGQIGAQFTGDRQFQLAEAFDQMTPLERQVFVDAAFDAAKDEFVKQASEFNRTPQHKRKQFLDSMIDNIELQRRGIAGVGGGGGGGGGGAVSGGVRRQANLTKAFESSVPRTTDGMTRALVDRTTARQRAKAQPLFDAIAIRYKERQEQQRR